MKLPIIIAAVAMAAGISTCAHAQVVPGQWGNHRQSDGPALHFASGKNPNHPVIFAQCAGDMATISVQVPASGGYAQASSLVGRPTQLIFNAGKTEFRFGGPVMEEPSSGGVIMQFKAVVGTNLLTSIRDQSALRVRSPIGEYTIRFTGAAAAIDGWRTDCGYRPPAPSPLAQTGGPGTAHAGGAAGGPPPILAARRAAYAQECASAGGKASFRPGFVKSGDFNGDSAPDYLLDLNEMVCSGGLNPYCGSRGCSVDVLMSQPNGGYKEATGWIAINRVSVIKEGNRDAVGLDGNSFRWNGSAFVRGR